MLFAEAGVRYYVQVGGCCGPTTTESGEIFLTVFPPPANDLAAQRAGDRARTAAVETSRSARWRSRTSA